MRYDELKKKDPSELTQEELDELIALEVDMAMRREELKRHAEAMKEISDANLKAAEDVMHAHEQTLTELRDMAVKMFNSIGQAD